MTAIEITQAVAESVCHAHGHLVFIGSLAGKFVTPAMGNYAIGKSALAAFAEAVRLETQPRGGHVLLVSPGPIQRVSVEGSSDPSHNRYDEQVLNYGLPNSTGLLDFSQFIWLLGTKLSLQTGVLNLQI